MKTPQFVKNAIFSLKESGVPQNILAVLPDSWLSLPNLGGILIEPTNFCNYKCEFCPINRGLKRKKGYMTLENFKKIIDEIKGKKDYIYMNFAGEPTLNRDVWKFARYARDNGIKSMISTNGSLLHTFTAEEILSSGLDRLLIAIDGASPETYVKYRQSLSGQNFFGQVIENVKWLCHEKSKWKGESPIMQVQFVVFKQNQHEAEIMKQICYELGVDCLAIKTPSFSFGQQTEVQINKELYAPDEKYARKKQKRIFCYWLWQGVILWNGDVTTCCYDYEGHHKVGNVFSDGGFWKVWNSKRFNLMRKQVLKGKPKLCQNCELPQSDYSKERVFYKEVYSEKANYDPAKEPKKYLNVIN